MNLYILGNGFDLMHNLLTRYSDFANFCKRTYTKLYLDMEERFPLLNIGGLWANFEEALGYPKLQFVKTDIKDRENTNSGFLANIESGLLKSAFGDWVYSLNQNIIHSKFDKYFNFRDDDLFITFNYTTVLENIYNIQDDRVLHIHNRGSENNKINVSHIFGHGEVYSDTNATIQAYLKYFEKELQGPRLCNFLGKHKGIDNIIVIGHSMAEIDAPYFKEIKNVGENIKWNIHYFGDDDKIYKINRITELRVKNYCLITDR